MTRRKSKPSQEWQEKKELILAKYRQVKPDLDARQDELNELLLQVTAQLQIDAKGMSRTQFGFVLAQMQELGLEGVPYVHARTYEGWRDAGRQVRRGEKSLLTSIVWIDSSRKSDDDEQGGSSGRKYPKMTNLFHVSQTDPIEVAEVA